MTERNLACRAGWKEGLRWIEADNVKIHETERGAVVTTNGQEVSGSGCHFLGIELMKWSADVDENVKTIIDRVEAVRVRLDSWNARAKEDEEHPPYEHLTELLKEALVAATLLRRATEP